MTKPPPVANSPGEVLAQWRLQHWPPTDMQQVEVEGRRLPIYMGSHDAVSKFAMRLSETMGKVSDHVYTDCRGKVPRWMAVPKVIFGVERINLAACAGNTSLRFESASTLPSKCGPLESASLHRVVKWFHQHPGGVLVARKPLVDLRAYVFVRGEAKPRRVRYYESGLVVAATVGPTDRPGRYRADCIPVGTTPGSAVLLLDHLESERERRSDRYPDAFARTQRGWDIVAPI